MTAPLRKARHLVLRFFAHYVARPLSPEEQRYVHDHLSGPCASLFWKQGVADQRHAITVARRVAVMLPGDSEAIEAALLHDVGKWRPNPGAGGSIDCDVLDCDATSDDASECGPIEITGGSVPRNSKKQDAVNWPSRLPDSTHPRLLSGSIHIAGRC